MSYTVIARRWRPQKLDDVVGQRAVTQTLRNAVTRGRIAQAFVFAGPRGVGKTTTARILARMLNCVNGPTADPCGACEACVEIADGRDMDVLEIDAATHTGIDNVREVIISGLAIMPVRDRYKVFIIDEVHQLSTPSFNALLKSIEEPPPHVAFIMATTVPEKIPDTIMSRSQLFEFRTISSRAIADQLKKIATEDKDYKVTVSDEAVALIARAAEGSMRDAETAFDQVIAFAGASITIEDVATVLGLVGRDLLFDILTAVADEQAPAAFELAGRAVESGYDLRMLCRELSRLVRDLMVLNVDPSRMSDLDIAPEGDRERLAALLPRFSREDLLRAFDQLMRAEVDIKNSTEPRHQLEMALLRWMHLRKLVPLSELIAGLQGGGVSGGSSTPPARSGSSGPGKALPSSSKSAGAAPRPEAAAPSSEPARPSATTAARVAASRLSRVGSPSPSAPASGSGRPVEQDLDSARTDIRPPGSFKDRLLAEIQQSRAVLYGTVVAQAQRIEVNGDRVTFVFSPTHRILADQVTQQRAWIESLAAGLAGRPIRVASEVSDAAEPREPVSGRLGPATGGVNPSEPADLKAEALASPGVQALLEIFPVEIRGVEEVKPQ
jgi:DNA polymerase-3 subunit gamma/tau